MIRKPVIADNAVDGAKTLLLNNQSLRGLQSDGMTVKNIAKVNTSEKFEFAELPRLVSGGAAPSNALDFVTKAYADSLSGSGEANTASNVGAGSQVFKAKTGVDLAFRSLVAGTNITLTQNANDITVAASGGGGSSLSVAAISSNYTIVAGDLGKVLLVNTSVVRTLTLPNPSGNANFYVTIKDASGLASTNNITVARFGSEQIEGVAASKVMQSDFGDMTFVTDGTNWFKIW